MSDTAETGEAGAAGWSCRCRPYNYEHFRSGDMVAELAGHPVLVHFGSYT